MTIQVGHPIMRTTLEIRVAAIRAYFEAKRVLRDAVLLFNTLCPGHGISKPRLFILRTAQKLKKTGVILDLKPPGRPKKVPEAKVKDVVAELKQGYKVKDAQGEDMQLYYTSMHEAVQMNDTIREVAADAGVGAKHLTRRVTETDPSIKYKRVDVKPAHTEKTKRQRVEIAKELLTVEEDQLLSTFFIDAKKMYVALRRVAAWLPVRPHDYVVQDGRAMSNTQTVVLYWFLCVGAVAGVVLFDLVTGTTDLERKEVTCAPPTGYKVNTHRHPSCWCAGWQFTSRLIKWWPTCCTYHMGQQAGNMIACLPGFDTHQLMAD
jgi:hypothetical protein